MRARTRTTLPLEAPGCVGQQARDIELALRRVPGVTRAHVNQATEMAYVQYDQEQCDERDLRRAMSDRAGTARASTNQARISSSRADPGCRDRQPLPLRARATLSAVAPLPTPLTTATRAMTTAALRTLLAATGFLLVAGFFLTTEHRALVFGLLPFLLILACPLLHLMLHRGHGSKHSHGGGRHEGGPGDRSAAAPAGQTVADQSAADQSVIDMRRRHDSPDHASSSEVA